MSRFLWRELTHAKKYVFLFILNLSFGLSGLVLIQAFKDSFQTAIESRSKELVGADIIISAREQVPTQDWQKIEQVLNDAKFALNWERRDLAEMFTMLSAGDGARLMQLRTLQTGFPFYGEFRLKTKDKSYVYSGSVPLMLAGKAQVWVYPEVLTQLQLEIGQHVKIGDQEVEIAAVVEEDPSTLLGRGSIAPRIFIAADLLPKLGLLQKGSTVTYETLLKITPATQVDAVTSALNAVIKNPAIRIESHKTTSESNYRMINYLTDYLGLVSLVGLLLSLLACVFLFHGHLIQRYRDMAIFKTLGMTASRLRWHYLQQIIFLILVSLALTTLFSLIALRALEPLLEKAFDLHFDLQISWQTLLVLALIALSSCLLVIVPIFSKLKNVRTSVLFQEAQMPELNWRLQNLWTWLPFALLLWGLSVYESSSIRFGSLFIALVVVSVGIFCLFFLGFAKLIQPLLRQKLKFSWRFVLLRLTREKLTSLSIFVSLALGFLLMSVIAQIYFSLRDEFSVTNQQASNKPSLFMFDIQDDQAEPLTQFLSARGYTLQSILPLVRARLEKVNDLTFEKINTDRVLTREEEREARSRNRGYNLTERDALGSAETIWKGAPFSASLLNPKSLEISVEKNFAQRLGLAIGDKLEFDVMGAPLIGHIVNLRKVKWTSFQPNFFIQFQKGVFVDTPKTYVASLGSVAAEAKNQLQTELAREFPNISVIDVSRMVDKLADLANQMGLALFLMAMIVFIAGLLVVYSQVQFQSQTNEKMRELLKVIGLRQKSQRQLALVYWFCLAGGAMVMALITSTGVSRVVLYTIFG